MWTNEYVGIPYKEFGRDRSGVDCWGLAHLVYREKYNIYLPSFNTNYTLEDKDRIGELITQYKEGWDSVQDAQVGDLVLFNILGASSHIGIVSEPNHFVHSREDKDVAVEKLDSFSWKKRIHGYYRYNQNTNLVLNAVPHPLRTVRYTLPVVPGTVLQEVFDNINQQYSVSQQLKSSAVIIVNGSVIEKIHWPHFVLKQDDVIEYRAVPRGSGIGRMIAMIAISIVAPYATAAILGATTASVAGGITAIAASAGVSVVTAAAVQFGVVMIGSLLVNAIAPIRPPEQNLPQSSERLLLVTGGSNRGNPYSPIPVILGRVKITPPLGAVNYITYEGESDNYLRLLLVWGYGPLSIDQTTYKIGNTAFDSFVELEHITLDRITEPDTTTLNNFNSLYGKDISQVYLGTELTCDGIPSISSGSSNINLASTPGTWVPTSFNIDSELGPGELLEDKKIREISIAIHFPQGLQKIDKEGNSSSSVVSLEAQYRVDEGTWNNLGTITASGKKKDGFTKVESFQIPSGIVGQIEIRVRRLHPSAGDDSDPNDSSSQPTLRFAHTSVLGTVTLRRNLAPSKDPLGAKIAKTAIKIKASDQLSNNIEGINGIVQTYCKIWNGTDWSTYGSTSNPAALFMYVLTHPGNARKIKDSEVSSKINLQKLGYWYNYCVTNGFEYNSILAAQKSILETLRDIAAAGRASPAMVDGMWTVNIDEPKNTIVQHFSPHNSWGFEATKTFTKFPDALRVTYYNQDKDFQESEEIIPYAGKTAVTAEVFESITLPGVTKRSLVIDHARWHMAQAKLRPEVYTLNTDIEYLVCNRGDRVKVTHDVPLWGLSTGRIKNRLNNNVFDLDEEIPFEYSKNYTFRIRSNNGNSITRTLQKDFTPVSASLVGGVATINFTEQHPFKVGDVITVNTSLSSINGQNIEITEIATNRIKYSKPGAGYTPTATVSGTVSSTDGYYSRVKFTSTTTESEAAGGDLFLYGELNKESQDLIILNIETTTNKTAKLTLVDYGVTDTYNIFTDYLNYTSLPDFETQITLQPVLSRNYYQDNEKPIITGIFSGNLSSVEISPGIYGYAIKVSWFNPENLHTGTQFVECEYISTINTDGIGSKIEQTIFTKNSIVLTDVEQGVEYKIRLRYVSSDGTVGPWTLWTNHTVQVFTDTGLIGLTISVDRSTRYLNITPKTTDNLLPVDFNNYEFKVFKSSTNTAFWDNNSEPENILITKTGTDVTSFNLRDFATPRLSEAGVKFRVACRMVGTAGNYLTDVAETSVYLTNL